jgi:hypothetical protein
MGHEPAPAEVFASQAGLGRLFVSPESLRQRMPALFALEGSGVGMFYGWMRLDARQAHLGAAKASGSVGVG